MDENRAIAAVFDRSAETYDSVIPFFQTFGRILVDVAEVRQDERVLDVAAGRGASALPAAGRGGEVVAVDLGTEMVRRLQQDAAGIAMSGDLSTSVADALHLPFADVFDVVLCGFLLHILPEPEPAAGELFRCLRPGGRCVVSYPTGGGEDWNFFGEVLRRHAGKATRPLVGPPPQRDLVDVLRTAGFRDIEISDVTETFVFDAPETWWRWVWSHGMRAPLEHFEGEALAAVENDMLEAVSRIDTGDGILLRQSARFIKASKDVAAD